MNLYEQAAADLAENFANENGATLEVRLTAPSGLVATLRAHFTHIGQRFDPETGNLVAGEEASVLLPLASLASAGIGTPVRIDDESQSVWRIEYTDPGGVERSFTVAEVFPDHATGVLRVHLETHK